MLSRSSRHRDIEAVIRKHIRPSDFALVDQ